MQTAHRHALPLHATNDVAWVGRGGTDNGNGRGLDAASPAGCPGHIAMYRAREVRQTTRKIAPSSGSISSVALRR